MGEIFNSSLAALTLGTLFLHYYIPGKFTLHSLQLDKKAEILLLIDPENFHSKKVYQTKGVKKWQMAFSPKDKKGTELDAYIKLDVKVETYREWFVLLEKLKRIKGVIYLEPNFIYALNLPKNAKAYQSGIHQLQKIRYLGINGHYIN